LEPTAGGRSGTMAGGSLSMSGSFAGSPGPSSLRKGEEIADLIDVFSKVQYRAKEVGPRVRSCPHLLHVLSSEFVPLGIVTCFVFSSGGLCREAMPGAVRERLQVQCDPQHQRRGVRPLPPPDSLPGV